LGLELELLEEEAKEDVNVRDGSEADRRIDKTDGRI
jgi:hypothetical protein